MFSELMNKPDHFAAFSSDKKSYVLLSLIGFVANIAVEMFNTLEL